jgi:hypothetical protein
MTLYSIYMYRPISIVTSCGDVAREREGKGGTRFHLRRKRLWRRDRYNMKHEECLLMYSYSNNTATVDKCCNSTEPHRRMEHNRGLCIHYGNVLLPTHVNMGPYTRAHPSQLAG